MTLKNLSVLSYVNGYTQWHYRTDTISDIWDADYFSEHADMFAIGDTMIVSGAGGAAMACVVRADEFGVLLQRFMSL
jgi:hypothetical protein